MSQTLTQAQLDRVAGKSSREAANILGVGKSTVNKYREIARLNGGVLPGAPITFAPDADVDEPKVLFIDIETKPAVVATFTLFKPYLSAANIIENAEILCFTYNWEGQQVHFVGQDEYSYEEVLGVLHGLLDQADIVVHFNGQKFDIPWIEGELNLAGFAPPSPFRQIDLYRGIRRRSNFIVNRLDYLTGRFLDEHKVTHSGMSLWLGCMRNDPDAWATMRRYAIQDTALLEPFYQRVRAWLPGHPSRAAFGGDELACTRCQSTNYQRRGFLVTNASKYQRYQCRDCGGWFNDGQRIAATTRARSL